MESGREEDRSERATPQKLRDARNRGQIAKSVDVNSALVLLAGFASIHFAFENGVRGILAVTHGLLAQAGGLSFRPGALMEVFRLVTISLAEILFPLFAAVMIAGIAANVMQSGVVWSVTPLKPDVSRLNPVNGFKRVFSKRALYELGKTLVKVVATGTILYLAVFADLQDIVGFLDVSTQSYVDGMEAMVWGVSFVVLAAFGLIALFDFLYTRWEFSRRMMMSRREVKEEIRRREGDPLVRAKIRQLRQEALKRAASQGKVKDANVVVTNPTHLAVALRYDRDTMSAPRMIAKGAGLSADVIRRLARRSGVPVVENRALARELFRLDIDGWVPEALFPQVAKLLVWAALVKKGAKPA